MTITIQSSTHTNILRVRAQGRIANKATPSDLTSGIIIPTALLRANEINLAPEEDPIGPSTQQSPQPAENLQAQRITRTTRRPRAQAQSQLIPPHQEAAPPGVATTSHSQNSPRGQGMGSAVKTSTRLTARNRIGNAWTEPENEQLMKLVEAQKRLGKTRLSWVDIHKEWERLRSEGKPLLARTKLAITGQYNNILKAKSTATQNTNEQTASQSNQTTAQQQPPQPPNEPPVPPNEPTADTSENPEQEAEREFKMKFHLYFSYATAKYWRKPLNQPVQKIPEETLEWANKLITHGMRRGPRCLGKLNALVYAAGRAINWFIDTKRGGLEKRKAPDWIKNLTDRIQKIEADVHNIDLEIHRRTNRLPLDRESSERLHTIIRIHNCKNTAQLRAKKHDLETKLATLQRKINAEKDFLNAIQLRKLSPKFAYRGNQENADVPIEATRNYWEGIIGETKEFQTSPELEDWARDIRQWKVTLHALNREDQQKFFEAVCSKARPWKAPGPDGIQNFWWKRLTAAKTQLFEWILEIHERRNRLPKWLSEGRIILLYKNGDRTDPSNYRPIACLNTCYKIMTGMLTRWMNRYFTAMRILPEEQLALKSGIWGCTQAHVIDRVITADARLRKKNLSIGWIDYQKAFDNPKHKYLKWSLKKIGIPENLRFILKTLMGNWTVKYQGKQNGKTRFSSPLKVQNGLLQGDTLSPLLFCVAITPISHWLRTSIEPYETSMGSRSEHTVSCNHQYYMDDLKLYTNSTEQLSKAFEGVERIGGTIGLAINAKKCAVAHLRTADTQIQRSEKLDQIPELGINESYKYLGIDQNTKLVQGELFERLNKAVLAKAKTIWESARTFGQKVSDTNMTVMAKARYVYQNIIIGNGKFESLVKQANALDGQIRAILNTNKAKQQITCTDRLYVDRAEGGFNLQTLAETLEIATIYAWCYIATKPELANAWHILSSMSGGKNRRTVLKDVNSIFNSTLYGNQNLSNRIKREANRPIIVVDGVEYSKPTLAARRISQILHEIRQQIYMRNWRNSVAAGRMLQNTDLDLKRSLNWISKGFASMRVIGTLAASQEGLLMTKLLKYHTTPGADTTCRMKCHLLNGSSYTTPQKEMVHHITSLCEYWRPGLMLQRHNNVAKVLHQFLCRKTNLTCTKPGTIDPVLESERATLYWDHAVITEHQLIHNRPDIVFIDKMKRKIFIIEVRVSWPTSIIKAERSKYIKYAVNSCLPTADPDPDEVTHAGENLQQQLTHIHRMPAKTIPVVIGVHGEISKNTYTNLAQLGITPEENETLINGLSKAAALGTYRIIRAHLANPEY